MTVGPGNEIDGVEWRVEPGLTDYATALAFMQARVDEIRAGTGRERIWLVEHPPVYTAGTSAKADDLIDPARSMSPGAVVNTPIMARASALSM